MYNYSKSVYNLLVESEDLLSLLNTMKKLKVQCLMRKPVVLQL